MIFIESGLTFEFPKEWIVKKYDNHHFYKGISGMGMSAVDFICITEKEEVLLFEVKNYQNRHEKQMEYIHSLFEDHNRILANRFIEKIEETIVGIRVIAQYLAKSRWNRWRYKLLDRPNFKQWILQDDRLCWLWLNEQINAQPNKVKLLLWLELPPILEDKRPIVQQQIFELINRPYATTLLSSQVTNGLEIKVHFLD